MSLPLACQECVTTRVSNVFGGGFRSRHRQAERHIPHGTPVSPRAPRHPRRRAGGWRSGARFAGFPGVCAGAAPAGRREEVRPPPSAESPARPWRVPASFQPAAQPRAERVLRTDDGLSAVTCGWWQRGSSYQNVCAARPAGRGASVRSRCPLPRTRVWPRAHASPWSSPQARCLLRSRVHRAASTTPSPPSRRTSVGP